MKIRNGEFRIRTAEQKDAGLLTDWWNDGKVMAHAGYPKGLDISKAEVLALLRQNDEHNQRLIIELGKRAIGEMNYRTVDEKLAQIGIKICDSNEQNKAYGTVFLKMLIEYIFIELKYEKIIVKTKPNNHRAQEVYERIGFKRLRHGSSFRQKQAGDSQLSVDYEPKREDFV